MAARRKKATRRRRRFTGINVLNAAQAYTQLSIWSTATVGLNPWAFLTESTGGSSSKITLKEVLGMGAYGGGGVYPTTAANFGLPVGAQAFDMIRHNFSQNWIEAAVQSTVVGIGFTVAKKLTKSPRRMGNKMLKQLGVGDVVRL